MGEIPWPAATAETLILADTYGVGWVVASVSGAACKLGVVGGGRGGLKAWTSQPAHCLSPH